MSNKFILLTTQDTPVIIGVSSIALIEPSDIGAKITLMIARGSDLYPKAVYVTESFDDIKKKLEL